MHFDLALSTLADVGYRALAVNVSDVAAMGATPRLALLSLILPGHADRCRRRAPLDGLRDGPAVRVTLAEEISRPPGPLIVDVSLLGSVRPRKVLSRSGGRPGDLLHEQPSARPPRAWVGCGVTAARTRPAERPRLGGVRGAISQADAANQAGRPARQREGGDRLYGFE